MAKLCKRGKYAYVLKTANNKYWIHWKKGRVIKYYDKLPQGYFDTGTIVNYNISKMLKFLRERLPFDEMMDIEKQVLKECT